MSRSAAVTGRVRRAGRPPGRLTGWEACARPDLAERLEFDSEGGMFCALGSLSDLTHLKAALEPVTSSAGAVREIVARAETTGLELDD
ncbi:hypothetical protein [Streptomyces sp. NPDC017991]|uniref:hypothetical protein n=1 Tax=Streptomyces sp. NPDC017991 TaxID=3365026 RepID=UPI0037B2A6F4